MPLTEVTPTAFTLFDGVQTISNTTPDPFDTFQFATNARGEITAWQCRGEQATTPASPHSPRPSLVRGLTTGDRTSDAYGRGEAFNGDMPGGVDAGASPSPDAGSTLSLMTLTLMALGLVARRFQRAAG